jgi:hypothetical protein
MLLHDVARRPLTSCSRPKPALAVSSSPRCKPTSITTGSARAAPSSALLTSHVQLGDRRDCVFAVQRELQ